MGAVRLVYRDQCGSLEHLDDRASLVKKDLKPMGEIDGKQADKQRLEIGRGIRYQASRLLNNTLRPVQQQSGAHQLDTSSSMKLGRSSMGSTSSQGSEEQGRLRRESTQRRDVETGNSIDLIAVRAAVRDHE